MKDSLSTRWAAGLNVLAGIWILISPWVLQFWGIRTATGNNIILGIAILVLGIVAYSGSEELWASWVNLILGCWMIISAYVLGFSMYGTILTNNIVSGVVVGVLALIALSTPMVVTPTYRATRRGGPTFTSTLPTDEELRRRQEEELRHEEALRRIEEDQHRDGSEKG